MASHQAIREVIDAFNAGQLQLEFEIDWPMEVVELLDETYKVAGRRVLGADPPEITLDIQARSVGGERLIMTVHQNIKTERIAI